MRIYIYSYLVIYVRRNSLDLTIVISPETGSASSVKDRALGQWHFVSVRPLVPGLEGRKEVG